MGFTKLCYYGRINITVDKYYSELFIECNDLQNEGGFPIKYTHRAGDISPEFKLKNLDKNGKTIVIIFDDVDKPMNNWVIWNLPVMDIILENILEENVLVNLGNAKQKRQYRGPNPPNEIIGKTYNTVWLHLWIL